MQRIRRKDCCGGWYLPCIFEVLAISLIYIVGGLLTKNYNLIGFLWMATGCIAMFLYFVISSKNLLDLRGIVFASITGGVAMCQLRLSGIQVVWEIETWICHALGLSCFCIGFHSIKAIRQSKFISHIKDDCAKRKIKALLFKFQPERVYYAAIFLAVMPIVLFIIQVKIKGFIPILVQRYDAYTQFYTRLSIFINLVSIAAPLAFWCLKNLKLNIGQRILMWMIIPLPTIIFQLMVQRGLFIWSICILLVMVYFQSKHKFVGVLMVAILLVFGVIFSSAMRNIPADAMKEIWLMGDSIIIDSGNKETKPPETLPPETLPPETLPPETLPPETKPPETLPPETLPSGTPPVDQGIAIKIPDFLYAPYYYVINGLENFNNMVVKLEEHSYGLKQLAPFTVVLRFPALKEAIASYPSFSILPNSTRCLTYDFYHDFGLIGIVVEMLLLGLLSAVVQDFVMRKKDLFAYLEYGVLLAVLLTAFFAAWISEFATWLYAGTAFLVFLYTYFSRANKKERNGKDAG